MGFLQSGSGSASALTYLTMEGIIGAFGEKTKGLARMLWFFVALCLSNHLCIEGGFHRFDNPFLVTPLVITAHRGTSVFGFAPEVPCARPSSILQSCFWTVDLVRLISVKALQDNFTNFISDHWHFKIVETKSEDYNIKLFRKRCLIVLLLLISGNVQPNPGPISASSFETPADFKSRYGLGFIHLNVRSLISKMDMIHIWAQSTDADVIVLKLG